MNDRSPAAADRPQQAELHADNLPGAVVVGGDYQGLGIVRSLGRHHIPVCVIDDERSIARYSRYVTHAVHVPNLRNDDSIVKELLALARRLNLKGWVLFPTREEIVAAVSRNRAQLTDWFRVPTPSWDTIQWVWDKRNTCDVARKLGLPIPETWNPRTTADLGQITTPFPLAVKPSIKEHFFYTTRAKGWSASNPHELETLFHKAQNIAGTDEILVQEMIPGGGLYQFGYCAFFKDGHAVASMVSRRLRQHPHDFGRASTFVETVERPELEALSVSNVRAKSGRSWIRMLTDFPTAVLDIAHGRLSLSEYLHSLRTFDIEAVFNLGDPMPGVVECILLPYLIIKRGF